MGRTVAVIWHASFSIIAAALYFFFVLPRWLELTGQTSSTLGLVLRIVTGVLIGLTALPVVFTLLRTQRPELGTPLLALRLRTVSIALHVLAGLLIIGAAVSEIWLSLDSAGQWLFGIYGAAAAIALLGIFGFYLAFVAELPPPAPKPLKTRQKTSRRGRRKAGETDEATEADDTDESEVTDVSPEDAPETETTDDTPAEVTAEEAESTATEAEPTEAADTSAGDAEDSTEADVSEGSQRGKLRNRRPSNKGGTSRLRRRSRGGVAVED